VEADGVLKVRSVSVLPGGGLERDAAEVFVDVVPKRQPEGDAEGASDKTGKDQQRKPEAEEYDLNLMFSSFLLC
jgi:hypothetical protein